MKEALYCFTMDDVAMQDYSTEKHYENVLDFCREQCIKATFFVLPRSGGLPLTEKPEYCKLLKRAMDEGHEIAQHGLEHDRFESGIPPEMILNMPHEAATKKYLADHREELEERHTVEALRAMLVEGRDIISRAVGIVPAGFRAPSAAVCQNLNTAEFLEGYRYDSSIMMQKAAWDLLNGVYEKPYPINRQIFDSMQPEQDIIVIPGAGEYTWYLAGEDFNLTFDLARHDFHKSIEAEIPFVSVSHVSPIQQTASLAESDIGFKFYRKLFAYFKQHLESAGISFKSITLSEASVSIAKNGMGG